MKRVLAIVALFATLSVMIGCKPKEESPTIEFQDKISTVLSGSSVEVTVNLDKPAPAALAIPVEFTSDAVKGVDYSVSAEVFNFALGTTSSSITITDNGMKGNTAITIKLLAAEGVKIGTNFTAVVTKDAEEALIYSFNATKAELIESSKITLTITGQKSGAKFMAAEDLVIPFTLEGDAADFIESDVENFVIKKGGNSASVTFKPSENVAEAPGESVLVKVDNSGNDKLIPGDNAYVRFKVHSELQTPSKLLGTWTFSEIYDYEVIYLFADEDGYDADTFPLENEGFTLTFTEDEETGAIKVTPSGDGAFNWFFRESTITMSEAMSIGADGEQLGKYTSEEANLYMFDAGVDPEVFTHYSLDPANRSFDATKETLGKATIAIALSEDGTSFNLLFKDYDLPPFLDVEDASIWYDGDIENFDSDLLGFGCRFEKAE